VKSWGWRIDFPVLSRSAPSSGASRTPTGGQGFSENVKPSKLKTHCKSGSCRRSTAGCERFQSCTLGRPRPISTKVSSPSADPPSMRHHLVTSENIGAEPRPVKTGVRFLGPGDGSLSPCATQIFRPIRNSLPCRTHSLLGADQCGNVRSTTPLSTSNLFARGTLSAVRSGSSWSKALGSKAGCRAARVTYPSQMTQAEM
jgi:hypothetical protein